MADFDPHKIPYRFGMMDFLTAVFLIATPASVVSSQTQNAGAVIGVFIVALVFTVPGLIWGASIADVFGLRRAWQRALIQILSFTGFIASTWLVVGVFFLFGNFMDKADLREVALPCLLWMLSAAVCYAMFRLDEKRIYLLRKRYKPPKV